MIEGVEIVEIRYLDGGIEFFVPSRIAQYKNPWIHKRDLTPEELNEYQQKAQDCVFERARFDGTRDLYSQKLGRAIGTGSGDIMHLYGPEHL